MGRGYNDPGVRSALAFVLRLHIHRLQNKENSFFYRVFFLGGGGGLYKRNKRILCLYHKGEKQIFTKWGPLDIFGYDPSYANAREEVFFFFLKYRVICFSFFSYSNPLDTD